jgi:hypothetical protein
MVIYKRPPKDIAISDEKVWGLNRRASILAGHKLYGDVVIVPSFLGQHLYQLLRTEYVSRYTPSASVAKSLTKPETKMVAEIEKEGIPKEGALVVEQKTPSLQVEGSTTDTSAVAQRVPLSSDAFTQFGQNDAEV